MKPKESQTANQQVEMFNSRLDQQLNPEHALYRLAGQIDWERFDQEFGPLYQEVVGRPGLPTRLMVGLHYLKHAFNESDESIVWKWIENPYWQYFCGYEYFQHRFPCHPTSLVKWRQRVKAEGVEVMLAESIKAAQRSGAMREIDVDRVIVDTTVQEKAIAYPTDARLYHKARTAIVTEARKEGVELRQSYKRTGKKALFNQGRLMRARQTRKAQKEIKKLRNYLGRVLRDVERKHTNPSEKFKELMDLCWRIHQQERGDSGKVYSVHAPEVECISKGKAHKKYEFGCKASVVATAKSNWVIGLSVHHGNPYDGATLKPAIDQVERITGRRPKEAFVDRGYHGTKYHPEDITIHIPGRRRASHRLRKWLKRRNAIEPIISHNKQDNRLGRNYLKGREGDHINAILSGCGYNLRKLLRAFFFALKNWPPQFACSLICAFVSRLATISAI